MSVCLAQFFVATTERRSQLVLQLLKVPEFPLYIGELFLNAAAVPVHRAASDSLAVSAGLESR